MRQIDNPAPVPPGALQASHEGPNKLVFAADGTLLIGDEIGGIDVVDATTGRVTRSLKPKKRQDELTAVALSRDGSFVVGAGYGGTSRWVVATGELVTSLPRAAASCPQFSLA